MSYAVTPTYWGSLMRYICGISLYFDSYETVEAPCIYYDYNFRNRGNIEVAIRDSDSGEVWYVSSDCNHWDEFESELERLNPYGYLLKDVTSEGRHNAMLVVIDDLSLKFLEYVDRVEPVPPSSDAKLLEHLRSLDTDFIFWDEYKSLADVNPHAWRSLAFPLFQCLCFARDGWYGDNIYINTVWDGKASWHRVVFTDVVKVRSLFAKAAIQGYDPIRTNASVINLI